MQNQKINYDKSLKESVRAESGKSVLLHCCCAPCASHCIGVLTGKQIDFATDSANEKDLFKADLVCQRTGGVDTQNKSGGLKATAFYYNPAIMPFEEYQKRGENLKRLCAIFRIDFLKGEYDNGRFLQDVRGLEGVAEGGDRCKLCFVDRLTATAIAAKDRGYDYFCTTLTVSPHKNSTLINELGFEIAANVGVDYLPSDFKKTNGYLNSIKLSDLFGLYRQDYCGCIFSKRD